MDPFDQSDRAAGTVTRVEALNYRSLRYVSQPLLPFQVLVGPNASGKSTFLDVIAFLGDLVRAGVEGAIEGDQQLAIPQRAPDGAHLVWMRQEDRFELAVELEIPAEKRTHLKDRKLTVCRYEISIDVRGPLKIAAEALWLKPGDTERSLTPLRAEVASLLTCPPGMLFPRPGEPGSPGWIEVLRRKEKDSVVEFHPEYSPWWGHLVHGVDRSALASLPGSGDEFPVATWVRQTLLEGVHRVALSGEKLRRPSPPGRRLAAFLPDGSNLPWLVHELEKQHPERLVEWVVHVREALPDLEAITTRERIDDRHRYLVLKYGTGLEAPSWLVSDGTLRLLALTLLAYLPNLSGIYLVEEPENGIHPRAIETVFQSLSSVYGAQVLLATHSPVVLGMAEPEQLLCFARNAKGATDIVRGDQHPRLKDWRGAIDLGTLFATGVLG